MAERRWIKIGEWYRQASVSVNAGATTSIFSEKAPPALSLRITGLAIYAGSASAWGNLAWDMLFNGTPIYPYNGTKDQIGLQNQPVSIQPVEFPPASLVGYQATNTGAVAYVAGVVLRGEYGYYE